MLFACNKIQFSCEDSKMGIGFMTYELRQFLQSIYGQYQQLTIVGPDLDLNRLTLKSVF